MPLFLTILLEIVAKAFWNQFILLLPTLHFPLLCGKEELEDKLKDDLRRDLDPVFCLFAVSDIGLFVPLGGGSLGSGVVISRGYLKLH